MPGIFGIVRKREPSHDQNAALIGKMRASLMHYPFYESETKAENWFAVGSVALPGPDKTRIGTSPNGKLVAAYGGYIYGFRSEPAGSTTNKGEKVDRLVDVFVSRGREIEDQIDGSFNVALFDNDTKTAVVGNDRMGHRQLYFAETDDLFLFAPEAKAILATGALLCTLDPDGAADFLNFGYPLGERTMLAGIHFLRGGHRIVIERGKVDFQKYWDFAFNNEATQDLPDLIEEVDAIYRGIIKRRVDGYASAICPLSGGLDSRFITGHVAQLGFPVHSFTHGRRNCHDHRIARQLAEAAGVENYNFIDIDANWLVDYLDQFITFTEGMVESSPAILLGIGEQYGLPVESTCFLNGIFGGPTNFGSGYFGPKELDLNLRFEDKVTRIAGSYGSDEMRHAYHALFSDKYRREMLERRTNNIRLELTRHLDVSDKYHNQKDVYLIRNRLTRYMNTIDCNRFRWHDHFAMSDDQLLEFYIKLPAKWKMQRRFFIEYIKTKFPALARVPYQATGVDLYSQPRPDRFGLQAKMNRAKFYLERLSRGALRFYNPRQYTHQSQWYRANRRIRDLYEGVLLDDRCLQRGYFEPEAVRHLLRRQRLGGNSFYELSALLTFELFLRKFIDNAPDKF